MQASKLNPHGDPRDEPVSHSRRGFVRRLSGAGILTLTAPEPLRAAGGRHGGEPIPGRRMPLIYVVDDEPDLLTMERLVLEEAGFGVETFGDRAEAWRAVDRRRATPDLLITDYVGSPFSAATLIQNCREVVSGLRVLLVTGHPDIVSGSAWPTRSPGRVHAVLHVLSGGLGKEMFPGERGRRSG